MPFKLPRRSWLRHPFFSGIILLFAVLPARADGLAGTWLAFHDVNGATIGHIEELRLGADGAATIAIHHLRSHDPCSGPARLDHPECVAPSLYATGRLIHDATAARLTFDGKVLPRDALPDVDGKLGPAFWLAPGRAMDVKLSGRILHLTPTGMQATLPAQHPKLRSPPKHLYVRADAELAADLLHYADFWGRPMALLACVVPIVAEKDASWQPFLTLVRDIARIETHLLKLQKALGEAGGSAERMRRILGERDEIIAINPRADTFNAQVKRLAPKLAVSESGLETYARFISAERASPRLMPPLPASAASVAVEIESCINAVTK